MNLTDEPYDKRGWIGTVEESNYKTDKIRVKFDDGNIGNYLFNCLEILHSKKNLIYNLNANIKNLNKMEIDTMRKVIELVSIGEEDSAFTHANITKNIQNLCITDTETFYKIKRDIKKSNSRRV